MLRKFIIDELEKIKEEERDYLTKDWVSCFFAESNQVAKHVSNIYLIYMNDEDLVRFFKYILLTRNDISRNRINKTYFN